MKKIIVNGLSREKRMAVIEDEQLQHIHIMNTHEESLVGNIYVARVEKTVPGMDAAFVNFGREKNGFLHKEDLVSSSTKEKGTAINQLVTQGERLLVQVLRDETEYKGARVTGFIEISTPYMVYIAHQNYIAISKKLPTAEKELWKKIAVKHQQNREGMLIRTEMSSCNEEFFVHLLEKCRAEYQSLVKKMKSEPVPSLLFKQNVLMDAITKEMKIGSGIVHVDDFSIFQHLQQVQQANWQLDFHRNPENIFSAWNVEQQLEKLHKRIVWLENGSFLVIEEGEAMTTIDVNTGKFTGKHNKEHTLFETNVLAAREAMRQIKLRNISGMILIDFINSSKKSDKEQILREVITCTKNDSTRIQVVGFTDLGILQLTRKVTSASFLQYSTSSCPTCSGTGRVESAQAAAFRLEREIIQQRKNDYEVVVVEITKDVLHWFSGENAVFLKRLEQDSGFEIRFLVIEADKPFFTIKQFLDK